MCCHQPPCPSSNESDREAAHPVASYPEQGWSLLCNGIVLFEDTGGLLPDGRSIPPHGPAVELAGRTAAAVRSYRRRAGRAQARCVSR
ncbi:DUF5999 family protein [Streptosporangium soli]|nr:DUF5999 family protein [Streptosporangium sp. KLBMP 9127]